MAVDVKRLPVPLPADVPRVEPETGRPTANLLDWEGINAYFVRTSIADLYSVTGANTAAINSEITARTTADTAMASQITTLTASVAANTAAITNESTVRATADSAMATQITTLTATVTSVNAQLVEESTVRASADSAFASQITTLTANYNNISASGQIYFAVKAAPSGASAAYGLYLTAGAAFAGFEVVALSAGGSAINMAANKLMFSDTGTATAVFDYNITSPGKFTFNVPVEVRNGDIGDSQVSNSIIATAAVGSGSNLTTGTLTVRDGARVEVEVKVSETSGTIYLAPFSTSFISRGFNCYYNDGSGPVLMGTMYTMDTVVSSNFLGGSSYAFYKATTPSSESFVVSGLPAGGYTFTAVNGAPGAVNMTIRATETK